MKKNAKRHRRQKTCVFAISGATVGSHWPQCSLGHHFALRFLSQNSRECVVRPARLAGQTRLAGPAGLAEPPDAADKEKLFDTVWLFGTC